MNLFIVTGHTKGLGAALVERIARRPDNEIIALGRAADGPIAGGAQLQVDLADIAALEAAFDRLEARLANRRYERAVLVNNAGVVSPVGMLDRVDAGELAANLSVNLVAPLVLMRRFLQATATLAKRRRGRRHPPGQAAGRFSAGAPTAPRRRASTWPRASRRSRPRRRGRASSW